jgi:ABC-type branched-subunit amino acid transport system ATPase component
VLLVEHDIDRVFALADRVTVMNEGRVLVDGTVADARGSRAVQEVYIGTGTAGIVAKARTRDDGTGADLLNVDRIDTYYGKSHVLREASLVAREREIVALLGRNGAGKSTFLKTIIGITRASGGRISLGSEHLHALPAAGIARLGIGYVPQGRGLFAGMSVRDNLELGRLKRRGGAGVAWTNEKILEFFPRLASRLDTPADYLSGGEQQMVAVARALSGHVRVLLLDEPFEGLAPAVVEELFEAFDRLRGEVAMVIVEHNLDLVLALADRAYVLERGSVVHQGPARALREDLDLRRRVLWM